jgi:hypothetical protein
MEAVYIVQTRESIRMNENVYKIGRTAQLYTKRFTSYPKNSDLKIQMSVTNSKDVEYKIKEKFKQKFNQRKDMGIEYFEGPYHDLLAEFMHIVNSCDTKNNITLDFGKENLKLLFEDKDYNKNIEKCIKLGKYALQKSIDEIYFNDKFPENQTLKKERRNDKLVSIKYSGKWETRMFEDIYKDVMKITEKYHNKYMKELQTKYIDIERDIPFNKLMYPLRCFGHQMLWYGWTCNEIRNLGIELNDPDDDDELHRRIKAIKTVLLEKIYMKSLGTLGAHTRGSPCGSIPANCHVVY